MLEDEPAVGRRRKIENAVSVLRRIPLNPQCASAGIMAIFKKKSVRRAKMAA